MDLYGRDYLLVIVIAFITITVTETSHNQPCKSPQYIELGNTGIIHCSFNENVFLLVWYNSTDFVNDEPIVSYKSGIGYTTGEFDIHSNGSLIINKVELKHDHYFTVVMTNSSDGDIVPFTVRAIVTVKPYVLFPVIDQCGNDNSFCFINLQEDQDITCSIRGARPAASLKWMMRTSKGDMNISFDVSVSSEGVGFSTIASVPESYSELPDLALLVCISESRLLPLTSNESVILVKKYHDNITHPDPVTKFIQYKSELKLTCSNKNSSFLIWEKRQMGDGYGKTTIAAIHAMNNTTLTLLEDYYVDDGGSLQASTTEIHHEGVYTCLFGNGLEYGSDVYKVIVFVPAHPVVDGCEHQQHCILEKEYEDSLTCRLLGIRPALELEWNILPTGLSSSITFFDHSKNKIPKGNFFDISLTSKYRLNDLSQQRLTVECKVSSTTESPFVFASNLDLLFLRKEQDRTQTEPVSTHNMTKANNIRLVWIALALFIFIMSLLIGLIAVKAWRKRWLNNEADFNETGVLKTITNSVSNRQLSEKKELFITQLKCTYEKMYATVQPVPFILEMFSVQDIFVEGGLEFKQFMYSESQKGKWERLSSYNDIFVDPRLKSKRYILEGEPGYGKSTMVLKLAYDWCSGNNSSSLKDVDILILLRLRQMGGRVSIPKAIKHLLLPEDSQLSEDDVETILRSCTSVLFVLDGYDEYPDFENDERTDVKKIIKRDIFQQANIVVTTRPYCLPKEYAAQAKRIRLTGFDEQSRYKYISKVVVGNNMENVKLLKASLKENPVLSDLCQVPLFFVMFAHITYERKEIQSFTSVTSFFRYIITSIYCHMQNKSNAVWKQNAFLEIDSADHSKLDREAFDSLNERTKRDRWIKDEMCEKIGKKCYDQFAGTGILRSEMVMNIVDHSEVSEYKHVQYIEEVRFYHKLFCEWYAAHHLSTIASECSLDHLNRLLKGFNPLALQYLFRFTCGMNSQAAENIIKHLRQTRVPDEIVILCIIEQTGNVNSIIDAVRDLCSRAIDIRQGDSRMMQRSIVQLLEIASTKNIDISCLRCWDIFGPNGAATEANTTRSRVLLPRLKGIICVEIYENDRILNDGDAAAILKYVSTWAGLKTLKFLNCVMPYTLKEIDTVNFEVLWYTRLGEWYTLDSLSGNWKMYVSSGHEGKETGHNIPKSRYDQLLSQPAEF